MARLDTLLEWAARNEGAPDMVIAREMQRIGVSPQEAAAAFGLDPAEASARYEAAQQNWQAIPEPGKGIANDEQAAAFFYQAQKTGNTNDQMARVMRDYGVTPEQASRVTNIPLEQVSSAYQTSIGNLDRAAVQQNEQNRGAMGLEGAFDTRMRGLEAALGGLQEGLGAARNDLTSYTDKGLEALQAGLGGARTDLTGQEKIAQEQLASAFGRAEGMFDPYRQAGTDALTQQAALSGARGQEAFDQAYTESPYVQFLREQGERGALRNAAATGGLGGGNVLKELSRFNQGLSGQGIQQQIQNLGALSGQGMGATGAAANLASAGGQAQAGLSSNLGAQLAGLSQLGGTSGLGAYTNLGANLGNLGTLGGTTAAQMAYGTGQDLGNMQFTAGRDLANNIANSQVQLANLASGQGQGLSNIFGTQAGNLSNLLTGYGGTNAQLIQQLANAMAGSGQQAAGQVAGLSSIPGTQQNQGTIGNIANAAGAIGTAITAFSDIRMKENIQHLGALTDSGANLYSWDWKPEYRDLVGADKGAGVIAQEIMESSPDAVSVDESTGFYKVDYSKV
jgi:hypothetical protein